MNSEANLQQFAEKVSVLCMAVIDGISGDAAHGTVKEQLKKLKDEADDIAAGLQNPHYRQMQPKYALVNLQHLEHDLAL